MNQKIQLCVKVQIVLKRGNYKLNKTFINVMFHGLDRYPICKECINKMIDVNNMETVYAVLRMLDIPFNILYWKSAVKNSDMPFRKYMSMATSFPKLRNFRYKDSIFTDNEPEEENTEELSNEKEDNENTLYFDDFWNGSFTKKDLAYLNKYYAGLEHDYNLNTTNYKDYAKKITKVSLEMDKAFNEMIETGNDKKYTILRDTFDRLCKSAKFAEVQRDSAEDKLGCFGLIFDKVEKNQWIPEYEPEEADVYDNLLEQFSNINKSL